MSVSGKAFDLNLLKRVLRYARPYKLQFYGALFLTVISGFIAPVRPWLIMYMLNDFMETGDGDRFMFFTFIFIGIMLLEALIQYFQTYAANWLGQSIIRDMRQQLFQHILRFRMKYFDKNAIGTLVTRAVSDMDTVSDIFSSGILVIIGDILKLVCVIVAMFIISWKFSLVVLIPIPILLFATNLFKNAIKKAFQRVRTQVAKLNAFVQEHVTGMSIVQIFAREKTEYEKFVGINKEHRDAHISSVWAYSIFFPVVELLSAMSLALLILWGILGLNSGVDDVGYLFSSIVAFILWIHMLYRPIRMLADRFNTLQMGMVGAERIFGVLDTDEVIKDSGEVKKDQFEGKLEFKNVWFAYKDDDYVLKNLSFDVKKGEKVAFVGATGAGKSSVINLLSRFYEFQKGDIIVDGESIRKYDLECLRKNISVVLQDVFLFSDTIYNNITLHDPRITKEEVIEAAKQVGAHEFIMRLPGNYDYNVRERGGVLSAGQRQLISFIRAYVFNPSILVLDEATSNIDTESELLIQKATEKVTEGRTSIIIAHRLSTIQKANKIIVLDKGEIVEMGTHEELLKKDGGYYNKLFEMQFA